MIKIKPILYGNFIDVSVAEEGKYVDGEFVEPTKKVAGKAIVMPWNTQKDKFYLESGGYTTDDRKAYSYDKFSSDSEMEVDGNRYKIVYIPKYNEAEIYFYGLKKIGGI